MRDLNPLLLHHARRTYNPKTNKIIGIIIKTVNFFETLDFFDFIFIIATLLTKYYLVNLANYIR
ncbi:hypothetical protein [Candidatus Bandiella numerosa]|uniref:hypothetical protein n=1 Tax=Candidatus Bandiella numerosa TaxID=2570586 RepID=UPI001F462608|nr:hypothetical protein [Candidatus Bandiella numerosa]